MSILSSLLRALFAALRTRAARAVRSLQAARLAMLGPGPANIAAIENLARSCLDSGNPQAARDLYVRRARLLREPIEPRLYRNAYMSPGLRNAGKAYTHVLRDVLLETTYGTVFQDDRVYILETWGGHLGKHPWVAHRFSPDLEWFVASCPAPARTIEEPFVLLGTDGRNYSHWLTRYLLKLALLEKEGIARSLPLLVNDNLRSFQRESLDLLGIAPARLLCVPGGIALACREIVVPVLLRNHPQMRMGIDWLRARLAGIIEPASAAGELLFVSRRDSPNHTILNEAEIEAALASRGFRTVVLGELPFAEQVRSFAGARIIVGGHGAGLTNLIFARPGAAVVEITSTNLQHMNDFRHIAALMGQRHIEIASNRYAEQQPTIYHPNYNYYADADAVLEAVDALLAEGGAGRSPSPL